MLFTHRDAGGRCPCGAAHAACGPPSDVVPVDERIEEVAAVSGGPLKKYRVVTSSGAESVIKYNAADAKRLGLGEDDLVENTPQVVVDDGDGDPADDGDESTPPDDDGDETPDEPQQKARRGAANKARTPGRTKGGTGGGA